MTDTFYIRVRPDFAMYDLISQREYIFDFIAFSQQNTPVNSGKFIDLQVNEAQLGFANSTANYYRHYLIDRSVILNITVKTIQGNPAILIKVANTPSYPISSDPTTYDQRVDTQSPETGNGDEYFKIDPAWRYDQDIYCDRAGYTLWGGNLNCTIFFSIECTGPCVYKVIIGMEGRESGLTTAQASRNVPVYLTGENYYTGSVGYNQVKYFYYPVTRSTGDTAIFLNKTGPLGKNGDARLILAVQNDAATSSSVSNPSFDTWNYPSFNVT